VTEARGREEERAFGRQILVGPASTAGVALGDRAQAVVERHEEDPAVLAGHVRAAAAERDGRVQVVARVVDEAHRPAQAAIGVDDEEAPFTRADVHVILGVDGR
jgi:hypothetical protein